MANAFDEIIIDKDEGGFAEGEIDRRSDHEEIPTNRRDKSQPQEVDQENRFGSPSNGREKP